MAHSHSDPSPPATPAPGGRRDFLSKASGIAMIGGLAAGYGTFAHVAGRYLYPSKKDTSGWFFVATTDSFPPGSSRLFQSPDGAKITIARQSEELGAGFLALSSVCPHLGCQVHWEGHNRRFFCPCHNGTFDATGKATGGPPAEAGQSLPTFPLKVEGNLVFINLALTTADAGPPPSADPEAETH